MASKYKIKKEINMSSFDFLVNDPTDSKLRPIKINSELKSQAYAGFKEAIKRLNKDLGLSNKEFSDEVIEDIVTSLYNKRTVQDLSLENLLFHSFFEKDKLYYPTS